MDITKVNTAMKLITFFVAEDGEAVDSKSKTWS